MYQTMTQEQEEKIIQLYQELNSTKKVASQIGCSRPTVSNILKKYNILNRNQQNDTEEFKNTIIHAYTVEKLTTNEIKEKFHIGKPKIKEILQSKGIEFRKEKKRKTTNDKTAIFIKRAKEIHANENLDYSKVEYVNNITPVCIIDHDLDENGEEFGEYWQTPSNHLRGSSHPKKRNLKIRSRLSLTKDEFIKRAKEVHCEENLDYSQVNYINLHTKVLIIDNDLDENGNPYGEYWQEPSSHLKGCKHPRKSASVATLFNVESNNCTTNTNIKEVVVNAIKTHFNGIEIEVDSDFTLENKLDIFFPRLHFAVNIYDVNKFGEWVFDIPKNYMLKHTEFIRSKGIKLINIFSDEWYKNPSLILHKISHILNKSYNKPSIMARKCLIKEISTYEACEFLNKNHVQGSATSSVYLGAFYNNKLVAVMLFKKEGYDKWDLNRFASDNNYRCQGIGGKLFKYFVTNYNPIEIKSFADKRWTTDYKNNIYIKLGFKEIEHLSPNYTYCNPQTHPNKRFHKFGFRKTILSKKFNLPIELSETEMVQTIGYDRIWDCGLIKYVWKDEEKMKTNTRKKGQKLTQEEFLTFLKTRFEGDITCDDVYIKAKGKLKLYCHKKNEDGSEHGQFIKTYDELRIGRGCPICMGRAHYKARGFWKIKENCEELAKTCSGRYELERKNCTCYRECVKNGWLDEFQEKYFDGKIHYRNLEDKTHCIYVYLISETHSCYIGRTSSIKRRHNQHKFGWQNSKGEKCIDNLYKHCASNNIEMPEPIILESNLSAIESQEREEYWLTQYRQDGWNALNKGAVGKNRSSLGATLKWTYEKCKEEASKYKSKQEFRNHNQGAYNAAYREKWLNEFFPELACKPNGYWDVLENCQEEALKFTGAKAMIKGGSGGCYNSIKKHGWQKLITYKNK